MTRIIAGTLGGRRIAVPPDGTRPTTDRVREALFSSLESHVGLLDAFVLDVCAGSGALGMEALSRGAAHALFVESDRRAAATLRRNLTSLGLLDQTEVRVATVNAVFATAAPRAYDLLLIDPPYAVADEEVGDWIRGALAHGWLTEDATVVVERPARSGEFAWPPPLRAWRERRYGDNVLHMAFREPVS